MAASISDSAINSDNKENIEPAKQCSPMKSPLEIKLPRTPLQDKNVLCLDDARLSASLSKVMKKARYSPITPISTPTGKSSRSSMRDLNDELYQLNRIAQGVQHGVPLNALVMRKALCIVEDSRKTIAREYEERLAMREQYIQDLEISLKSLGRECKRQKPAETTELGVNTDSCQTCSAGTQTCLFHSVPSIGLPSLCTPLAEPSPLIREPSKPAGTLTARLFDNPALPEDCVSSPTLSTCDKSTETAQVEVLECGTSTIPTIHINCDFTCQTENNVPLGNEVSTQTDNISAFLPRPSISDPSELDVDQLARSLKTSAISNTILREELLKLEHQSKAAATEVEKANRILEAKYANFERETQQHISDLLAREADLLSQNAKASAEVEPLRKENKRLAELSENLQKDLLLSYKQKKTELEKLKQEMVDNDYKPHFLRLQEENTCLRAQLSQVDKLEETIVEWGKRQDTLNQKLREKIDSIHQKNKENLEKEQQLSQKEAELKALEMARDDRVYHLENQVRELEDQVETTKRTALENQDFLTEEKSVVVEELDEAKQIISKLKKDRELLMKKLKETQDSYNVLTAEFENTKENAHHLLIKQGAEISESLAAFTQLTSSLSNIRYQLQGQSDLWKHKALGSICRKPSPSSEQPVHLTPSIVVTLPNADTPQSLVASVITSLETIPREDTPQTADSVAVRLFTEDNTPPSSAFRPVRPRTSQDQDESMADDTSQTDWDLPLSEHVSVASDTVKDIVGLLIEVRGHVTSFMKSLEGEINKMQEQHKEESREKNSLISTYVSANDSLKRTIEDGEKKEKRLLQTIEQVKSEKENLSQVITELKETLELRNSQLVETAQQESQLSKMKDELRIKTALLSQKEAEIEQLTETNASLKTASVDSINSGIVQENVHLQKEVRKLQTDMLMQKEKSDILKDKANQRLKTLNNNWRTAEEELRKLDDLIERVGEALRPHIDVLHSLDLTSVLTDIGL